MKVGFWNSVAILLPSLALSMILSSVTGYALALWNVRWAGTFLFLLFMEPLLRWLHGESAFRPDKEHEVQFAITGAYACALHADYARNRLPAALKFAGYDHTFVFGTEGHNGKHGGASFPDTLRRLWRDFPKT